MVVRGTFEVNDEVELMASIFIKIDTEIHLDSCYCCEVLKKLEIQDLNLQ
jgi:hypothetical protein